MAARQLALANQFQERFRANITRRTFVSNLFLGAGLYYAIENEKYWQIPLPLIHPSMYVGYHTYKNRVDVAKFLGLSPPEKLAQSSPKSVSSQNDRKLLDDKR